MRRAHLVILGLVTLAGACRTPVVTSTPRADLTRTAAESVAELARLGFAGMPADTTRWRLRVTLRGFPPADSARVDSVVAGGYAHIIDARAQRELYVESEPFSFRGDTADLDVKIGALSSCRGAPRNSFAAYRLRFLSSGGTWAQHTSTSLGHTDSAPCL